MSEPSPAGLQAQALFVIHAWLARDYWSVEAACRQVAGSGATPVQVLEAATLAAASLLTEALGGSSAKAAAVAADRYGRDVAAQARLLAGSGH